MRVVLLRNDRNAKSPGSPSGHETLAASSSPRIGIRGSFLGRPSCDMGSHADAGSFPRHVRFPFSIVFYGFREIGRVKMVLGAK